MLDISFVSGDIQINEELNNFVLLENTKNIVEQNLAHHIGLIKTSYDIRPTSGIPWLDYLHSLNNDTNDSLMISYITSKVIDYPGIVAGSVSVTLDRKVSRNAFFSVSATYNANGEDITIGLERSLIYGGA